MNAGWHSTTLKDLCVVDWGNTDLTKSAYVEGGEFLAVSAAGCDGRIEHKEHSKYTPVLSAIGAQCGKMFFPEEDFTAIKNTITLTPNEDKCDSKFLYYLLTFVDLPQRGAGQPFISKGDIEKFKISCPTSLLEQQHIVAILDEAFASIATAAANAKKSLANARELFQSALWSAFNMAWQTYEIVTLSELATDITDGDHMPPPKAQTGVPFITIGNIEKNTRSIDFADTFMVPRKYFDELKANKKPRKGDVLYTVTGSFGIPVLINEHREFCFQRHIGLVRPKREVSSEWLYYLLMSPQIFAQANEGATGTAQKTVSLKLLRNFQVPLVPMNIQRNIVENLSAVNEETKKLESIYQHKLSALDELKKSILNQAFTGQLH